MSKLICDSFCERKQISATFRRLAVVGLLTAGLTGVSLTAEAETWSDSTGTYNVEAEFLRLQSDVVYLKKQNGVTIAVPMNRLSSASQQQAKQLAGESTPAPAPAMAVGETPDAAMRAMIDRLSEGDPSGVWDALPASYQQDVNSVIHAFGENMDAQLWKSGSDILKKAVRVLKEKKAFILAQPEIAAGPVDQATIEKNWDVVVDLLDTLVNSEITDLAQLQTIDMKKFLAGTGQQLTAKFIVVATELGGEAMQAAGPFADQDAAKAIQNLKQMKFEVVDSAGDRATLRVTQADGKVEETEMVRVEGKWIPAEMAEGWGEGIAAAKDAINTQMGAALQENKMMALMMMGAAGTVVDQLLAASTQEEFDEAIGSLKAMGEGPGGPGGPEGPAPPAGDDPFGPGPFGN